MHSKTLILLSFVAALLAGLTPAAHAQGASYGETHRLKVNVDGTSRKVGFFVPKNLGKKERIPVLVALPDGSNAKGKAFRETGQFERMAYEGRFAVLSVDLTTSGQNGWLPSAAVEMERDTSAVVEAIAAAKTKAKELGISLDWSATAIHGHSGACYPALWIGLRHPDQFLVIGLNGVPNWFKEFTEIDLKLRDANQRIFVYSGERDVPSVKRGTKKALEELKKAGYRNISVEVVKAMAHARKPEVFVAWYSAMLKSTSKARKDAVKIRKESAVLKAAIDAGKGSVLRKLMKLVERERKNGFSVSATALLREIETKAQAEFKAAEDLAADHEVIKAASAYKAVESRYRGLEIAKIAKTARIKLTKSDEYAAFELLAKAKAYLAKGNKEKAAPILIKITEKYPESIAAEEAEALLE